MFENLENRRLLAHTLTAGVLTIEGTAGADRINIGMHGTDLVIRFNDAQLEMVPAADVDAIVVNGNDGSDTITLANHATANVTENATLNGGGGNDVLNGGGGNDRLDGGLGNDRLNGGTGADVMVGGDGHDGVNYAHRTTAVNVTLDGNADDGAAGEGDNVAADVENVASGSGNDTIVGSGVRNQLNGGGGNDSISGGAGNDVLLGGAGNDTLNGDDGNDQLNGGAGNDDLNGGAHNDALDGGAGADDMSGGSGIDTVSYAHSPVGVKVSLDGVADDGAPATIAHPAEGDNAGADIENIQGSRFSDELIGNALNNRLSGGDGNDTLRGGDGNDTLNGGHGSDQLFGEAGNDVLMSRDGTADLVDGGDGDDRADRDPLDTLISVERANPLP